jgi:phage-related protein
VATAFGLETGAHGRLGVKEVRLHGRNEYRVMYVAKFAEAVYVLHAFVKKTPQTSKADIELARTRLKHLIAARQR